MIKHLFYFFVIVVVRCFSMRSLRSIQLNMYLTTSFDSCQRYLTRTNVTGCSSGSSGNRGRLLNLNSTNDFARYRDATSSWIVLIRPEKDLLEFSINEKSSIVGILIDGTIKSDENNVVSEVGQCPENSQCHFRKNPHSIDFRSIQIDKPIFLLTNRTAVEQLRNFSSNFNEKTSNEENFIDVQMKSYPFGVKNGQICERRSKSNYFADAYFKHYMIKCRGPMINLVWATLNAISLQTPRFRKSVIVFYTKFDFFSIFQPKNAGVQSTGCAVVTLLGLAWILGQLNLTRHLIETQSEKDLLFLFVNGENWNSYGTHEFVRLVNKGVFPYKIDRKSTKSFLNPIDSEHLDAIVNIDQLGCRKSETFLLYKETNPFFDQFQSVGTTGRTSLTIKTHQIDHLAFFTDFLSLNISSLAMLSNFYDTMNPFYNSYQDTIDRFHDNQTIVEHVYLLMNVVCQHFNLNSCRNDFLKDELIEHVNDLIDCFFRSNCSRIVSSTSTMFFREVSNEMKENFSFLQPMVFPSDSQSYLNEQFLDGSSYLHDILLNSIADRQTNVTKDQCDQLNEFLRFYFYQTTTNSCLRVSMNSINLLRDPNEPIDDRWIFTSNSDSAEFLVFMKSNLKRDFLTLICGILLTMCGFLMNFFLKRLIPFLID